MKIKEILVPGLKTISLDASMADAEKIMKESHIRHLPVLEGGKVIGIVSDRDIRRSQTLVKTSSETQVTIQPFKKVSDYMSTPVHTMNVNDTVDRLTKEMARMKISSFIIEDEAGRPVGIITTYDLLLLLLDKLDKPKITDIIKKIFSPR